MPEDAWSRLGGDPGLCRTCQHAKLNETRRGTVYLRCTRAAWDPTLARYPRLPIVQCPGFQIVNSTPWASGSSPE
jgi:hypothetical protein